MQNCVVQEADESKIKHNFLRLIKNKLTYVYLIISENAADLEALIK